MLVESLACLDLASIDTLIFAGGGNRCWWQAGAISHLLAQHWRLPTQLVGTSGGAAVAAAFLTAGPQAALASCQRLYAGQVRMFEWRGLLRGRLHYAHRRIYPAWLASFVDAEHFQALRQSRHRLQVAITRPARWLGLRGSIGVATLAYLADKFLRGPLHPGLPRRLGLRQEFRALHDCSSLGDAHALLAAAGAALPFIPARCIDGEYAFDGGYIDNAPLPPQSDSEKARTLVLLTRHYPKLPSLFRVNGRNYWQPGTRVPVGMLDCTVRATVLDAWTLGERNAQEALMNGSLRIA
ncbi:patatin-like phospholipase family protein [Rhodanobacter sp. DHG33]|uniref:patatin-like phospholipase family protein n=1 Tax=Rhodanobacter sp. DHG33 TaxID=2775921 RepID=UPI00177FA438|nr:patatin-like phospholipase family protein [Rhodanobacter sp. DHG33]MBD8898782.1 patatin-like phospholipase family protein [Rhodanobacter sp. DHG33]